MTKKRNCLAGFITLAITATTYTSAFAYVPIGDNYHIPADKMEVEHFFNDEADKLVRNNWIDNNIQAPLIKYNPQKVWRASSNYEDGLKGSYIHLVGDSYDSDEGGSNYGGGFISLTKGAMMVNSAPYYGKKVSSMFPRDYNIYARSAIASDYAHECGHWYYDDALSETKWGQTPEKTQSDFKAAELRADAFGIRLLENVPYFSVGGDMISTSRMAEQEDDSWIPQNDETRHPSPGERFKNTYNYIKKMGHDTVRYYEENAKKNSGESTFYIKDKKDGEYWEIKVPNQYVPSSSQDKTVLYNGADRAKYVMGQVAWAVKNNCWDEKHLNVYDGKEIFNDIPDGAKVSVLVAEKNENNWKVIDWFADLDSFPETQKEQEGNYINSLLNSAGVK